ncbi:MAG: GNAT family N-acetyltransferase [Pasteurella oralis]|uniref:tRNA(Met) cytidine acetyltransferase TmcA n=1 Tax=Pasteurella oralis TaxID=1071947 RepID=UPI002701C3DC|nr:GNAT family N-acetyltransferase [Pasteurella oralis]
MTRHVVFWQGTEALLVQQCLYQVDHLIQQKSAVWIGECLPHFTSIPHFPFHTAKNLLGREFSLIIYNGWQGLNLEALAVASGTLTLQGTLLILLPDWQDLVSQPDQDSLRWCGEDQPITTPHFSRFFQQKVAKYAFPVYHKQTIPPFVLASLQTTISQHTQHLSNKVPTFEQQQILSQLIQESVPIFIVTAKRGRGKSALAGLWAKYLVQQKQPVILTAPNKNAVNVLREFADVDVQFLSPDQLYAQIQQNPQQFEQHWLLIDEAAMIPLPLLNHLTASFKQVLCTTTMQSYEGTGRGFLLKFMANLKRPFVHLQLHTPLRWQKQDKLEAFIDELLLLQAEDQLLQLEKSVTTTFTYQAYTQQQLVTQQKIIPFYALLTLAHYRTSPVDLRRLFDAPKQQFYVAESAHQLVGAIWLVEEGGLIDEQLIWAIERGIRRPRGNLVAQALCFQAHLPDACRLKSGRISRIAVLPQWQQQGIGRQLVDTLVQGCQVDFLSVSFGYTTALAYFWQKCGFFLVNLGEQKEASSGCYSVIAVKPLTAQGEQFCQQAKSQFERNLAFSFHPLRTEFVLSTQDWQLLPQDITILQKFADYHTTLSACLPSIQRLMAVSSEQDCPSLRAYCQHRHITQLALSKQNWLKSCRLEVKKMLQKYTTVL